MVAIRVIVTLLWGNVKLKNNKKMWIFTLKDGTVFKGNREEIAKQLNFFEDVYDDEVWDEFCTHYTVEHLDEPNEDIS